MSNWNLPVRMLHWLSAALVVACIAAVWGHEGFANADPTRAALMQAHFLAGGLIGFLAVVRLAVRVTTPGPRHVMPRWMAQLATWGHRGLYVLMVCLPVAGYLAVSAKGPVSLFDLIGLPAVPVSDSQGHLAKEIHEVLGNLLVALIGLHLAAVFVHEKLLGDKVLKSMLGRA